MRKILTKPIFTFLSLLFIVWTLKGQQASFVLEEGFETWPPAGWTLNPTAGQTGAWMQDEGWYYGPYYSYQGQYSAVFDHFNYNVGIRGTMTSPRFNLDAYTNPQVSFTWYNDAKTTTANQWGKILVQHSLDGTTWAMLGDTIFTRNCTKWAIWEHAIPKTAHYIRIQAISNYGASNTFVDFVHIGDRPYFMPAKLTVPFATVMTRSVLVTWDSYDGIRNFEIVHGKKGFKAEEAIPASVQDTVYTFTNLDAGTEYQFCVRSVYSNGQKSGWSSIKSFKTLPTCPSPVNLMAYDPTENSIKLVWTEKGDAKKWNLEYGPEGFKKGSGTIVTGVSSNPYTLNGLEGAKYYEVYVQGDCSAGDTSTWIQTPAKFMTSCYTFTPPYLEDFESCRSYIGSGSNWIHTFPNPCWEVKKGNLPASGNAILSDGKSSYDTWYNKEFAGRPERNLSMRGEYSGDRAVWLITPSINLGDGTTKYMLQFDAAYTFGRSKREPYFRADDRFIVLISTDNGATWNKNGILRLWDNKNSEYKLKDIPNYGSRYAIDLSAYSGQVKIAFYLESKAFGSEFGKANNIYIDNMSVRQSAENQLSATYVKSPEYPALGIETEVKVLVQNIGSKGQKDFTIELLNQENKVLASKVVSTTIYTQENLDIPILWTPSEKGKQSLHARISFNNDVDAYLLSSYYTNIDVVSPETKVTEVGNGKMRTHDAPFSFFFPASTTQCIYYEDELPGVGAITAIKYKHIFGNKHNNVPIRVYLGSTNKNGFASGTSWIHPDSMLLVYQHVIDSMQGDNDLLLTFDRAYTYKGGNLVIMIQKDNETPLPSYYSTGEDFWQTEDLVRTQRVLIWAGNDGGGFSTSGEGVVRGMFPNTTIYLDSMSAGKLRGKVTDKNGNPIKDVLVELVGTANKVSTNASGEYEFSRVLADNYTLKASKFAYADTIIQNISITDIDIKILNFSLKDLAVYKISGKVTSNAGNAMKGVSVLLKGYQNYEASTISDGSYTFYNVYDTKEYDLTAEYDNYQSYHAKVQISGSDVKHDISLVERVEPPVGLHAEFSNGGEKMDLVWENPSDVVASQVILDDGTSENGMAVKAYMNVMVGNQYKQSGISYIHAVDIYGEPNTNVGDDKIYVEIYDKNRIHVLSSYPFRIPENEWVRVEFPSMAMVEGDYYVMVHWKDHENNTHYLSADETGPHAKEPIIYYVATDGTWLNMVEEMGSPQMVFMIRPHVYKPKPATVKIAENYQIWKVEPGKEAEPETWNLMTPEPITATNLNESMWSTYPMGSRHKYAAKAFYTGDISSSASFSQELIRELIAAPVNLVVRVSGNNATLIWSAPENANPKHYILALNDTLVKVTQKTSFTFSDLKSGSYKATLYAQFESGKSEKIEKSFQIGVSNEWNEKDFFFIYPNPAKDRLQIESISEIRSLKIYDAQGRIVYEQNNMSHSVSLDINSYSPGIYMIELSDAKQNSRKQKLMIVE